MLKYKLGFKLKRPFQYIVHHVQNEHVHFEVLQLEQD